MSVRSFAALLPDSAWYKRSERTQIALECHRYRVQGTGEAAWLDASIYQENKRSITSTLASKAVHVSIISLLSVTTSIRVCPKNTCKADSTGRPALAVRSPGKSSHQANPPKLVACVQQPKSVALWHHYMWQAEKGTPCSQTWCLPTPLCALLSLGKAGQPDS